MAMGARDNGGLDSVGGPTDPVVCIVAKLESQFPGGVPYELVIQRAARELCMQRAATVREVESLVEDGALEKSTADRLVTVEE